jgi:hypothetical protein
MRFESPTETPHRTTLLALVQSLWDESDCEAEVVETATDLVCSGRVVLTGNFAGCPLIPGREVS